MVEKTRNPGLHARDFETVLRRSIAAAAIVDVPATVLVAVITLSRLLGDTADEGARYTADRRANRSATNIACYCTPDNCAGGSADTGALLGRRAACNRKSNQSECNNLLNQILLLGWSPSRAVAVPDSCFCHASRQTVAQKEQPAFDAHLSHNGAATFVQIRRNRTRRI